MIRIQRLLPVMIVLLVLSACSKDTEEDKVKKVITGVQQAAEEKKISTVLDNLSKSYRDPQGNDYNGIKGLLAFYFFRHQKVSVYMPNIDIAVTGQTAKAIFQAILTGRGTGESAGGILPEALGAYNFEVLLSKEDGTWKVTSAKWERAGEGAGKRQFGARCVSLRHPAPTRRIFLTRYGNDPRQCDRGIIPTAPWMPSEIM